MFNVTPLSPLKVPFAKGPVDPSPSSPRFGGEETGDSFDKKLQTSESPLMQAVWRDVQKVARVRTPVLILGPTGTGKEVVAQTIHESSPRRDNPFVAINCGAIPDALLEAELFGTAPNSFTGAGNKERKGKIEAADSGTLFLDEMGEAPMPVQVSLLRFLESGEFYPVGATNPKKVNTRIIAATNRNLKEAVQSGKFREDLYFRLKVFPIQLPSLKDRKEDLGALVANLLHERRASLLDETPELNLPQELTPEAMDVLQKYHWPGNIRELRNVIEGGLMRAMDSATIEPHHLTPGMEGTLDTQPSATRHHFFSDTGKTWLKPWDDVYHNYMDVLIETSRGSINRMVAVSGMSHDAIHEYLEEYGLQDKASTAHTRPLNTPPPDSRFITWTQTGANQSKPLDQVRRDYVETALDLFSSNLRTASSAMGITYKQIYGWIKELKIKPPAEKK